jgi:hypothetical protein
MPYSNCPRCHLSIRLRHVTLAARHCPRCLARRRVAVPMFTSNLKMRDLIGEGDGPSHDGAPWRDPEVSRTCVEGQAGG